MTLSPRSQLFLVAGMLLAFEGAGVIVMQRVWGRGNRPATGGAATAIDLSSEQAELLLGNFIVGMSPSSDLRAQLKCEVCVTVAQRHESAFSRVMESRKNRLQSAVVCALRRASFEDVQEPSLESLKWGIRRELEEALGPRKRMLTGIVIPELNIFPVF